jgi:hypothetical protein
VTSSTRIANVCSIRMFVFCEHQFTKRAHEEEVARTSATVNRVAGLLKRRVRRVFVAKTLPHGIINRADVPINLREQFADDTAYSCVDIFH